MLSIFRLFFQENLWTSFREHSCVKVSFDMSNESDEMQPQLDDENNGLVLIDKPTDMTSHDVVNIARRAFHTRKVGHAGTLDPFATGLLILGINKGTKKLTSLVGLDKCYEAEMLLGISSTTDDIEGEKTEAAITPIPTREELDVVLDCFRGGYAQTAPFFSAKKINGKKLYELARKGKTEGVERPVKEVKIYKLTIEEYAFPKLRFSVHCSSGTYIRAIARDIGEALGGGGYLTALRRTSIGDYHVQNAMTIDALKALRDSE